MYQTGVGKNADGSLCSCAKNPNWIASQPSKYNPKVYALMSPTAFQSAMAQVANGASLPGNTFQQVDTLNQSVKVGRVDGRRSPASGDYTFSLLLNNSAGATPARKFIGDKTGTYVLDGNTELTPAGFVIGGDFSTNSLTQLIDRMAFRHLTVSQIQFTASNQSFFSASNVYYFDTPPNNNSYTKDNLSLSQLLNAGQYNPTIQFYTNEIFFDGVNGLDVTIPAGISVTLQLSIKSEGNGSIQGLVGTNR